jgi:predicted PurR-regulated permease PerM
LRQPRSDPFYIPGRSLGLVGFLRGIGALTLRRTSEARENSRLLGVVTAVVVIATLYFARLVFVPLALALLVSLLLTPVVTFLERIRVPRILAILLVVAALAGSIGIAGWKISRQLVNLVDQLPTYENTLEDKIRALKDSQGKSVKAASGTVKDLGKEITTVAPDSSTASARQSREVSGETSSRPLPVQIVPPDNPLESVQKVFGPLTTLGMVTLFTMFMLLGREDLRNRFIRLVGGERLNVTTQAMDDATHRINRYLVLQLLVNSAYGLVIGTALQFVGIPNALLWGITAAILRFLPYVGPPMAALPPIVLALAIFPGWSHALATLGLFAALELVVANFVEPLLYGAHIGLSALAILVAAIFWTLIWGIPGLLLSTPLTVCVVVLGRYVPGLHFLNVLLGDEPVLSPQAQYYQRLLAADENEARQILEQYLKEKSLKDLYSSVVIPALNLAEQDRHRNELDEETRSFIYQSTREIVEELGDISPGQSKEEDETSFESSLIKSEETGHLDVICIPARDDADDLVAMMLAQLLDRQGQHAQSLQIGTTDMLSQVTEFNPQFVCISALPPFALSHARALYTKLRSHSPKLKILVCLWHFEGDLAKIAMRLRLADDRSLFTTLPQVLEHIAKCRPNVEADAKTHIPAATRPQNVHGPDR